MTFAQAMLRHTGQGVALSELVLNDKGVPPDVESLAVSLTQTQRAESEELTRWLLGHGQPLLQPVATPGATPDREEPGDAGSGSGTSSGDESGAQDVGVDGRATVGQVRALGRADGVLAGRLYLRLMTRHHQGALAAAGEEAARGQDAMLVALARQIIGTQQPQLEAIINSSAAVPPLVPGLTPPSGQVPPR